MLTTFRTAGHPIPEQSLWHTPRLPTMTRSSASRIAKLPLMEPLEPPTCTFCGCASGITPVEPGLSTTAAPAASANARSCVANGREPPPAFTATLSAPATSAAARERNSRSAGTVGANAGATGRASSRSVVSCGWVLSGRFM